MPAPLRRTAATLRTYVPDVSAPADPAATNATVVIAGAPRGRGPSGPILSTQSLRSVLSADVVATLAFGTSPDGTQLGPDDFAATATVSLELPAAASGTTAELHVDAQLGADRNAVVRVVVADTEAVPARGARARVFLGDTASAGYRTWRAGIAEYVSLLPPNSHGEANPADKDPVPAPFDNTYNSPEHDAFVMKIKYQRTDAFFTANLIDDDDRVRLNHAWHDLFGSWPNHDAYLDLLADHYDLKQTSRKLQDLGAEQIAAEYAELDLAEDCGLNDEYVVDPTAPAAIGESSAFHRPEGPWGTVEAMRYPVDVWVNQQGQSALRVEVTAANGSVVWTTPTAVDGGVGFRLTGPSTFRIWTAAVRPPGPEAACFGTDPTRP
jgi:hypothetical protein